MKPETVQLFRQAVNEGMRSLGFNNWDEGMDFVRSICVKTLERLSDPKELDKLLSEAPEPSVDELELQLQGIKKFLSRLQNLVLNVAKTEIPPDHGGRPSVLGTPKERVRRVQRVLSLIGQGVKTTDAIKRVARAEGISVSSMQRIWKMRAQASDHSHLGVSDP